MKKYFFLLFIMCFNFVKAQEIVQDVVLDSVSRVVEKRSTESEKKNRLKQKIQKINELREYFSLTMSERCGYFLGKERSNMRHCQYNDLLSLSNQYSPKGKSVFKITEEGLKIVDTVLLYRQIKNYFGFLYLPSKYNDSILDKPIYKPTKNTYYDPIWIFLDYTTLNPLQRITFLDSIINDTLYTNYFLLMKIDLDRIYDTKTPSFIENRRVNLNIFKECILLWKKRSKEDFEKDYLKKG